MTTTKPKVGEWWVRRWPMYERQVPDVRITHVERDRVSYLGERRATSRLPGFLRRFRRGRV